MLLLCDPIERLGQRRRWRSDNFKCMADDPGKDPTASKQTSILVGSPPGTVELGLQVDLLRRELDIRGTYATQLSVPHKYWPWTQQGDRSAVMRLIASGEIEVVHLVSHVVPPEEADEVYRMIAAGPTGWMSVFFDWE